MAVDTATKRYSMINFGSGAGTDLLPVPDGTVDEGDRYVFMELYDAEDAVAASTTGREQRRVAAIIHRRRRRK